MRDYDEDDDDTYSKCEHCGRTVFAGLMECPYCHRDPEGMDFPCGYCGKSIPRDAPRCPYCHNYTDEGPPEKQAQSTRGGLYWLWVVLVIVFLALTLIGSLGGLGVL